MKNQEEKTTTVQEEWMGQTPQTNSNNKDEVVVRECSCAFD